MRIRIRSEQIGRQLDHLLVEQKLFAWIHALLAIAAGTACVLSIMVAYTYGKGHSWPRYGSQFILLVAFLVAAFPIAVSYLMCARRVIEEQSRAVGYMLFLIVTAMIVDIAAAVLVKIHYSFFWLLSLYYGQLSIYGYVGQILLGAVEEDF
jgi:hypothetical protein